MAFPSILIGNITIQPTTPIFISVQKVLKTYMDDAARSVIAPNVNPFCE